MRLYSDELRAQTHEFMNKLYVLSGLIQLRRHDAALDFIQKEASTASFQNQIVFLDAHSLLTIISNLLDNAFEAVKVNAILLSRTAFYVNVSEKNLRRC
jgi:sensor histidine kinase regulating citrate/malate metabolism